MTEKEAERICEQYESWKNQNVTHIYPEQVLTLVSVQKNPIDNNLFDVEFELNEIFTMVRQKNTQYEEFKPAKTVNYSYFKKHFILTK